MGRDSRPGLAVDADGERAFVVPGDGPIAEVDLRSHQVAYHALRRPVSLFGRFRNWLEPEAHAKAPAGPSREAAWVGDGVIAVSGRDMSVTERLSGPVRYFSWDERPAGLHLIDTDDWAIRTVDEGVSSFSAWDGVVVAFSDHLADDPRGGVTAYTAQGKILWRRFAGRGAFATAANGRVYVTLSRRREPPVIVVVDLRSGRVIGQRRARRLSPPVLVLPDGVNREG
jgi:hypothetical protein